MNDLSGKRILVVEDEFLIGAMLADMLTSAGAQVVGPAASTDEGVVLARAEPLDGAVLDVNLHGASSEVVAAELERRHVPFVLATGYGQGPQCHWSSAPVVCKPFAEDQLLSVLAGAIDAAGRFS